MKRNPQDATLRLTRAAKKRTLALAARQKGLELRIESAEARLANVEKLIMDSGIKPRKR